MELRVTGRSWLAAIVAIALAGSMTVIGVSSVAHASPRPSATSAVLSCGVTAGNGVTVTGGAPCVATMSVGDSFQLSLRTGLRWSDPHASSPVVTVANVERGANGGLTATVTAIAAGTATLSASGSPICTPGTACPQFILLWTLNLVVTGATSPPPLTITTGETGRHFSVHVGQVVVVRLTGGAIDRWSEPVARPNARLRRITGAHGNPAIATFLAERRGSAVVTSNESFTCSPKCQPLVTPFRVTIHVG